MKSHLPAPYLDNVPHSHPIHLKPVFRICKDEAPSSNNCPTRELMLCDIFSLPSESSLCTGRQARYLCGREALKWFSSNGMQSQQDITPQDLIRMCPSSSVTLYAAASVPEGWEQPRSAHPYLIPLYPNIQAAVNLDCRTASTLPSARLVYI